MYVTLWLWTVKYWSCFYNNQILTCKCDISGNKKHGRLHLTDFDELFLYTVSLTTNNDNPQGKKENQGKTLQLAGWLLRRAGLDCPL